MCRTLQPIDGGHSHPIAAHDWIRSGEGRRVRKSKSHEDKRDECKRGRVCWRGKQTEKQTKKQRNKQPNEIHTTTGTAAGAEVEAFDTAASFLFSFSFFSFAGAAP